VMMVTGERVDPGRLAEGYLRRPWAHVLPILVPGREEALRCEALAERYYRRSALKSLLVFDGIGMALDQLRGDLVEMGGITREAHPDAMKQIESTGIDRFLSVLSPTNGGSWDPAARFEECISYLECEASRAVFVSPEWRDLEALAERGIATLRAAWTGQGEDEGGGLRHPSELPRAVRQAIAG